MHALRCLIPLQPEPCPVPEQLLGELYSSPKRDLAEALSTMPGLQRPRLALFCNKRAHLHEMGLSIAATCSEADLEHEGGQVGAMLFRQSREKIEQIREHNPHFRRRPISLATMATSIVGPDADEEETSAERLCTAAIEPIHHS